MRGPYIHGYKTLQGVWDTPTLPEQLKEMLLKEQVGGRADSDDKRNQARNETLTVTSGNSTQLQLLNHTKRCGIYPTPKLWYLLVVLKKAAFL